MEHSRGDGRYSERGERRGSSPLESSISRTLPTYYWNPAKGGSGRAGQEAVFNAPVPDLHCIVPIALGQKGGKRS